MRSQRAHYGVSPREARGGSWSGPLLVLPARTLFIFIAQCICAASFRATGDPRPWSHAGAWWTVWGTGADVGCLLLLRAVGHREGFRLRDMIGELRPRLIPKGLLGFLWVAPFSVAGTLAASRIIYGLWQAPLPAGEVIARQLPGWAIIYSLVVWPPIWCVTEELTYNGYCAPRVERVSGHVWARIALVGFWWCLQHSFLPLVLDLRFFVWRFCSFVAGVSALLLLYRRTRSLPPVILAHWLLDLAAAASTLSYLRQ